MVGRVMQSMLMPDTHVTTLTLSNPRQALDSHVILPQYDLGPFRHGSRAPALAPKPGSTAT